jgi:hypothetical protein
MIVPILNKGMFLNQSFGSWHVIGTDQFYN